MFNAGTVVAYLELQSQSFNRGIDEAQLKVAGLTTALGNVRSALTIAGVAMTALGVGIIAGLQGSTSAINEFNKGIAQVTTMTTAAGTNVDALKEKIRSLAILGAQETQTVSRGAYEVASAYGEAALQGKNLEINVKAAAAGLSSSLDAIKLTSAVTKAFGDTTDESTQKVADLAFKTVVLGQTTFPELATEVGTVSSKMAVLGGNVTELFSVYATLTGVTGNASEVQTQFNGMLTALIKPSREMKKALEEVAISHGMAANASQEQIVQALGVVGTYRAVIATTDGTMASIAKLVRRSEALTGTLALTNTQAQTFDEKFKKMGDVAGSAESAFQKISSGANKTGYEMEQTKIKFQIASQRIGEAILPVATALNNFFSNVLTSVSSFAEKYPVITKIFTYGAAAAGLFLITAGPILVMLPGMVTAYTLLTAAITRSTVATTVNTTAVAANATATTAATTAVAANATAHNVAATATTAATVATTAATTAMTTTASVAGFLATTLSAIVWPVSIAIAAGVAVSVFADEIADATNSLRSYVYQIASVTDSQRESSKMMTELRERAHMTGGTLSQLAGYFKENAYEMSQLPPKLRELVEASIEHRNAVLSQSSAVYTLKDSFASLMNQKLTPGGSFKEQLLSAENFYAKTGGLLTASVAQEEAAAKTKIGLAETVRIRTGEEAKTIAEVQEAATEKIKELTLSETSYKIHLAEVERNNQLETLRQAGATKQEELQIERAYSLSVAKIRNDASKQEKSERDRLKKEKEAAAKEETKKREALEKEKNKELINERKKDEEHYNFLAIQKSKLLDLEFTEIGRREGARAEEIARIREEENDLIIEATQRLAQGVINEQQYADQVAAIQRVAAQKEIDYDEEATAEKNKNRKKELERWKESHSALALIEKNWASTVGNISQTVANVKMRSVQKWYDSEKSKIQNSTMNEEQKQEALSKLEIEADKRTEAIQKQAATRDKLIAAAEIINNTAAAIMKTIRNLGWPAAIGPVAVTAAIGAAQLAAVGSSGSFNVGGGGSGGSQDYTATQAVQTPEGTYAQNYTTAKNIIYDFAANQTQNATAAAEKLSEAFKKVVASAKEVGREGSKEITDMIVAAETFGLKSKAISDYIAQQNEAGLKALKLGKEAVDMGTLIEDLAAVREEMKTLDGAEFEEASKKAADYEDKIADVQRAQKVLGESGVAEFEKMYAAEQRAAENPALYAAMQSVVGQYTAISNTRKLSALEFEDFSNKTIEAWKQVSATGAEEVDVYADIAPMLERLRFLQDEYGYSIDATTQALIDAAVKNGSLSEDMRTDNEKIVDSIGEVADILKVIAKSFGADIPEALDKFGNAAERNSNKASDNLIKLGKTAVEVQDTIENLDGSFSAIGSSSSYKPDQENIPQFATGTQGWITPPSTFVSGDPGTTPEIVNLTGDLSRVKMSITPISPQSITQQSPGDTIQINVNVYQVQGEPQDVLVQKMIEQLQFQINAGIIRIPRRNLN